VRTQAVSRQRTRSSAALQSPEGYIKQQRKTLDINRNKLIQAQERLLAIYRKQYVAFAAKLDAMSPLKVLTRGYSVVQDLHGDLIKSVKQVEIGERLCIGMGDGSLQATVMDIKEGVK